MTTMSEPSLWTDIADGMPIDFEEVFVADADGHVYIAAWYPSHKQWYDRHAVWLENVRFWMRKPPLPEVHNDR